MSTFIISLRTATPPLIKNLRGGHPPLSIPIHILYDRKMPKGVFSLPVIVTLCLQWIFFYITQKPDQTSAVRRSLQVLAIIWEVFSLSPAILVTSRNTSSYQTAICRGRALHDETKTAVRETTKC